MSDDLKTNMEKGTDIYNCGSVSTFTQNTTLHGVKYVGTHGCSKPRRAIWAVVLLAVTVFFLYNIISLGKKFHDYDSYYSVKKSQESRLLYPAVSICSLYTFNRTALQQFSPVLYSFLTDAENFTADPSNIARMKSVYMITEMLNHSFSMHGTFLMCGIGRQGLLPCEKYLHRIFLDDGFCFTFNGKNSQTRLVANSAGVTQSITLVLDINLSSGIYSIHNSDMFKVVVHDPDDFPRFDSDFVVASPGSTVQVGIQKVATKNLGIPYSDECHTETPDITEDQRQLMDFNQASYSQGICQQDCRINKIVFQNKCKLFNLHSQRCSLYDWVTMGEASFDRIQSGNISVPEVCSHCLPKCRTVTYKRDITAGSYPSQDYVATLQKLRPQYNTMDLIKANIAEVRVFFKSLEVTYSDQKPAVPPADLYSNIGGLLGLCVGASAVTLFEFCDFAVVWLMTKLYQRKKPTSTTSDGKAITDTSV